MQIRKDTVKDPNVKEYIVVNKRDANWQDIHTDLTRDTSADSSIDSNIVPDRICNYS